MSLKIIFLAIATTCLITLFSLIFKNVIKHKNLVGWLYPEGSSKVEKIMFFTSLFFLIFVMVMGPLLFNH